MHRSSAVAVVAVLAALLLGAAPARAGVVNLQVDNSSPTNAAGARTQYVVTFTTSAAATRIDLVFPAGTSFTGYSGSTVVDTTAGPADIGFCDSGTEATLTIRCFRDSSGTLPAGHDIRVTLNGIINPGSSGPLTVTTNPDSGPATATVSVQAAHTIGTPDVQFNSPTPARGGRTVYAIAFAASSTGGIAYAANSTITLKFPTGTSFDGYSGSRLEDTTAASGDIGFCDSGVQATLTVTCYLDFNQAIAAGHGIRITLNGIANSTAATGAVTVSTSSDTAVASPALSFDPAHSTGPVTVTNTPPSDAAGARTVYTIAFTTSITGGIAYAANSTITLKFPTGTSFDGYSGSRLEDTTAASGDIGFCDGGVQATLTVTCYLDFNQAIAAGHGIRITLNGIANPSTAGAVTVSTTSDIQPLASGSVPVSPAHQVGPVTVDNASPTRAAGGRTVYVVGFSTSSTGGLAYTANSTITLKFPSGASFAGYSGTRLEDLTASSGDIGFCDSGVQATLTVTCYLDFNQAIGPSHAVRITLQGITNPSSGGAVSVSTTSDPQPVASAPVTVDAAQPLTQPSVDNATPTTSAAGRTVYAIGFRTSSTGGLAYAANSFITLKFPAGTSFAGYSGSRLEDTTAASGDIGFCDSGVQATLTITCYLDFNQAIGPSHAVKITLNGIANPSSAGPLTLSTTSDPQNVPSPDVTPQPALSVSALAVALASTAASATTSYTIDFTTSGRGALAYAANSLITLQFPAGTTYAGSNASTVTVGGVDIGYCDSGTPATRTTLCYLDFDRTIGAATPVRIVVTNIRNPTTESAGNRVTVSTSSDTVTGATPPYQIGADTTAPDTVIMSGGPSGSTATFAFSATEPGSTFVCRLDGPSPRGPAACTSPVTYTGLAAGAYTFFVTATDPAGNPDGSAAAQSFSVATAPTPQPTVLPTPTPTPTATPPPEFHKDVVVKPVSGKVTVRRPGTNQFVELDSAADIPLGSTIDVKAGRLQLSSVPKQGGAAQTATFYAGVFKITQPGGITQLQLHEPLARCPKRGHASAAAKKKKKPKTRKLWGEGAGAFRIRGQYSAATVRGTKWLVQDSCAGTLTRVVSGAVSVRDDVRHKTVLVRAGKRYLAAPRH
jgi:hypothetical protein